MEEPVLPSPTLVGAYDFETAENVDDYLKGLGVGLVLRKVHSVAKPHYEIAQLPITNQWKITVESPFKKKESVFRSLEKFQDETFDGRQCHTTIDVKDNGRIMTWLQVCEEGPEVESSMTATETGFTLTMKSGEFRCEVRFGKSQPQPPANNGDGSEAAPAPGVPAPAGVPAAAPAVAEEYDDGEEDHQDPEPEIMDIGNGSDDD